MTPACHKKLRAELKHIKEVERAENVREIEDALEHGDLRENAEYHAAKERQAKIDGRMRYLEYRIANAHVIDPATIESDKVSFGATVTLLDMDTDETIVYSFVGEDESDATRGKINIGSPIGRALLGKQAGDDAVVNLPRGDRELEVVHVTYKAIDP